MDDTYCSVHKQCCIGTNTSETFTLSGSRDMTAKGVSTISSFITVFCKLKLSVSTQLINSIHVDVSYSGSSVSVNLSSSHT